MTRAGERWISNAEPGDPISVTLLLRPATDLSEQLLSGAYKPSSPEQAQRDTAADPQDLAAVRAFAQQSGLTIVSEDATSRRVVLQGSAAGMRKAFNVQLGNVQDAQGQSFRGYRGAIQLPPSLANRVTAVLGLDERPIAHHA